MATGAGGSVGRVSPRNAHTPAHARASVSEPTHPDLAGRLRLVVVLHVRKDEHWVTPRVAERVEKFDDVAAPAHAVVQLQLWREKRERKERRESAREKAAYACVRACACALFRALPCF